jgi:hypothetical protein
MSILNFLKAEDHPYLVIENGDYQFLYIEKSDFEHVNDIKDFFIYKNLKKPIKNKKINLEKKIKKIPEYAYLVIENGNYEYVYVKKSDFEYVADFCGVFAYKSKK